MFSSLVGVLLLIEPNLFVLAQTCDSESEECAHTSLLQTALALAAPRALDPTSPEAAKANTTNLDRFIKKEMYTGSIPGLSVVVLHKDKVLWDGHYGSTDPQDPSAPSVRNDTFFQFASLSKTMIGVSAMVLYEKGLLDPADDVNTYLPFRLRNPNFPDIPITVHGLLTHTSSLSDHQYGRILGKVAADGDPVMSLEKFYEALLSKDGKWYSEERNFFKTKPQVNYDYCNVGAALAAYIVEIIAKKNGLASDYAAYVKSAVLSPLGVKNAGYFQRDLGGKAKMGPPAGARPSTRDMESDAYRFISHNFFSYPDYPDGTFKASALDYARVFGAFINDGNFQGVQMLKPETVKYMKTVAGLPCSQPCGHKWGGDPGWLQGNSIFIFWDKFGRVMLGHNAMDNGVLGAAWYNYDSGVGFVVLTNGDDSNSLRTLPAFDAIMGEIMNTFDTPDKQFRPSSRKDLDPDVDTRKW